MPGANPVHGGRERTVSVLIVQAAQIESQRDVIKLANAQLANRINLHLALEGAASTPPRQRMGRADAPTSAHPRVLPLHVMELP